MLVTECVEDLREKDLLPPKGFDDFEPDGMSDFPNAEHVASRFCRSFANEALAKATFDVNNVQRVSQVVACYDETVLITTKELRKATQATGGKSMLEHLVITYEKEWDNFCQRIGSLEKDSLEKDPPTPERLLKDFLCKEKFDTESPGCVEEIRRWASFRSQTVSRTIRGAVSYHKALKALSNGNDNELEHPG